MLPIRPAETRQILVSRELLASVEEGDQLEFPARKKAGEIDEAREPRH